MEKTTVFIIAIILFSLNGIAQITKGNWMVGGTLNLSSTLNTGISNNKEYKIKSNVFSVSPNLGYFIIDKLCVGTLVVINYSNPEGDNNSSYAITTTPFVRYYFLDTQKMVNFFAKAGYGFLTSRNSNGYKSQGYTFSAGPVIYFNSSVGLEMTLNYNNTKSNIDSKISQLFLGVGFQIHLEK